MRSSRADARDDCVYLARRYKRQIHVAATGGPVDRHLVGGPGGQVSRFELSRINAMERRSRTARVEGFMPEKRGSFPISERRLKRPMDAFYL